MLLTATDAFGPEKAQQTIRDNLEFDKDLAQHKLDDHWRHGRLRDVILARHLFYELNEMLYRQMHDRGRQLQDPRAEHGREARVRPAHAEPASGH